MTTLHRMKIADSSGHTTLEWDPELAESVNEAMAKARATFETHVGTRKGFAAAGPNESVLAQVKEFDPTAPLTVLFNQPVGG